MTDDELRAWRAGLHIGSRVAIVLDGWMHVGTIRAEERRSSSGERIWTILCDWPDADTGDVEEQPAREGHLHPLPSPDTNGSWLWVGPPRRRRRRRSRRSAAEKAQTQ